MQGDSDLLDVVVWSSPAPVWLIVISSIWFFCLSLFSFLLCRQKRTPSSFSRGLFSTSPSLFANHYLSRFSSFSPASATSYTSSLNTPLIVSDSKKRRDRRTSTPSFSFFSSSHSKREEKRNGRRRRRRHERDIWNHAEEGVEFSQEGFSLSGVYTGRKPQGDFVNERRRKLFVFDGEYVRKKILLLITLASFLRAVLLLLQVFTPLEQGRGSHPIEISLLSPEEFNTTSSFSSSLPIDEGYSLVHAKRRERNEQSKANEGYGEFHGSFPITEELRDIEEEEEASRYRNRFPPVSPLHVDTPPFLPPSWKQVFSLAGRSHDREWGVYTPGEGQGGERLSHSLGVTVDGEEDKKKRSMKTHAQENDNVKGEEARDVKEEEGGGVADTVQREKTRKEKSGGRKKRDVRPPLVQEREKKKEDMKDNVIAGAKKTEKAEERRRIANLHSLSPSFTSSPPLPYSSPPLFLSHTSPNSVHAASTSSRSPATPLPSSSSTSSLHHSSFKSLKKESLPRPSPSTFTHQVPSPPPSPASTRLSHSSSSTSSSFSLFSPPHPLWLRTLVRSLPPLFSLTAYTLLVLFLLDLYFARMFAGKRVMYVSIISFFSLAVVWILFGVIALLTLEHHTQNQAHLFARSSALLLGTSFTLVSVAWAYIGSLLLRCLYTSHQQQQFPSLDSRLSCRLPPPSQAHLLDHHRLNRPFYPPDPRSPRKKSTVPENILNKRRTFLSFFFPQYPPSSGGDRGDESLKRNNVFPRDKGDLSRKNAVPSFLYSSPSFHDILQPSAPQQPPLLFYRPRELHFQGRSSLSPSSSDAPEGMYSFGQREKEDLTHTDGGYETRRRKKEDRGMPSCSAYTSSSLRMKNPDTAEEYEEERNAKELHANSRHVLSSSASHSLPYHLLPSLPSPSLPVTFYGTSSGHHRDHPHHIHAGKEEEERFSSFSRVEKDNVCPSCQPSAFLDGEGGGWHEDTMGSRPDVIHRDRQKERDRKSTNGRENRFAHREDRRGHQKSFPYSRPSSSRVVPSQRDLPLFAQSSYPPLPSNEGKRFSFVRSSKDHYRERDVPNSFSSLISHTSQIDCENQTHLYQTAYRRVRFLSRCCPPLIAIRGIYLLLVGTQILPHYYPSKAHPFFLPFFFVTKHKETLDILLYLLTEFLPLSFVLMSFARKSSRRTKIRDEEEAEGDDEEDGESEREKEVECEWEGWAGEE